MNEKQELLNKIRDNIKEYCDIQFNFNFNPNDPVIRVQETSYGAEEINAVMQTLLSTMTTMGKQVSDFQEMYAKYVGANYAVMSNSGSSNNLLSVAALANPFTKDHLKPGDEVIVPALSWSTTIWPIVQHHLVPVFVDCDLRDFNLDLNQLENAIGPKTRAIKLVHVYGNPCNMDAIMSLARKHNLFVIEDCCEAMGAMYDNKHVGTFGNVGNFSFFFAHHITTMEGGISVTNDFDLTETMKILRAHGWSRESKEHQKYINMYPDIDPRFIFINQGYNLRPTELNAAMGAVQLPKLEHFNHLRRNAAAYLLEHLSKYEDFFHFQHETPKGKHVWFGFSLIVKDTAPFSTKDITTYLQKHRIESRPIIAGNMTRHPGVKMFPHRINGDLHAADIVMKNGFSFGCHQGTDLNACKYIVNVFDSFVDEFVHNKAKMTA
ncbi:MAG: aminotransferase class I/II-fold pyridoxal phosphate-dependent enzyme [Gammaproteobacteria bacterium]|nr:aminotransferase class I/II-fold pyridoxal phosphate-dependent enzyme [Gammaproteobacteria bacterium]MCW5584308.1 aminotransferase class I/II-fold pyridoxal phosphate-dependent enzyme [Gammaproteobacteria bacterium]